MASNKTSHVLNLLTNGTPEELASFEKNLSDGKKHRKRKTGTAGEPVDFEKEEVRPDFSGIEVDPDMAAEAALANATAAQGRFPGSAAAAGLSGLPTSEDIRNLGADVRGLTHGVDHLAEGFKAGAQIMGQFKAMQRMDIEDRNITAAEKKHIPTAAEKAEEALRIKKETEAKLGDALAAAAGMVSPAAAAETEASPEAFKQEDSRMEAAAPAGEHEDIAQMIQKRLEKVVFEDGGVVPEGFHIVNVMEEILKTEKIRDYMVQNGSCTCERCQADVLALCLTMLPAKYVVMYRKAASPRISYYRERYKMDIIAAIARATKEVHEHPHHNGMRS